MITDKALRALTAVMISLNPSHNTDHAVDDSWDIIKDLPPAEVRQMAHRLLYERWHSEIRTKNKPTEDASTTRRGQRDPLIPDRNSSQTQINNLSRREREAFLNSEEGKAWRKRIREEKANELASIYRLTAEWKARVRTVWNEELLATVIADMHGHHIEWGDAPLVVHIDRRAHHLNQTRASMHAIVKHEEAIELITSTGTNTLREALRHLRENT